MPVQRSFVARDETTTCRGGLNRDTTWRTDAILAELRKPLARAHKTCPQYCGFCCSAGTCDRRASHHY